MWLLRGLSAYLQCCVTSPDLATFILKPPRHQDNTNDVRQNYAPGIRRFADNCSSCWNQAHDRPDVWLHPPLEREHEDDLTGKTL